MLLPYSQPHGFAWGGAKADDAPSQDSDGFYQIGSAADLVWFSSFVNTSTSNVTAKAVLTADIDMSGVANFTPIGLASTSKATHDNNKYAYQGIFDGQGHTISNLTISVDDTEPWQAGLFSRAFRATIKNIMLNTVSIEQTSATASAAGALIGRNGSSYVTNCAALNVSFTQITSKTSTSAATSGLVGYMSDSESSIITNCYTNYATLNVKGEKGVINNSYCGDEVTTKAALGELCYLLNENSSENPVWFQMIGTDAYPVLNSTRGTVYKNGTLKCDGTDDAVSYANTDTGLTKNDHSFNEGVCSVCELGFKNGIYELSRPSHLTWFSSYVNEGNLNINAVLTADIDMAGKYWTPMTGFTGTFDGNGKTISNLGAPLCLTTAGGATIQNLTIDGTDIVQAVAAAGFGAFVANHTAGKLTLTACTNRANITSLEGQVGGLVGKVSGQGGTSVELTRCNNYGKISSAEGKGNLAGIMGDASCQTVTISDCHNYGNVTMMGTIAQAAGILATHRSAGNTKSSLTVEDCHNEGAISGGANGSGRSNSGGIVGWVAATSGYTRTISIARCYNTGSLQFSGSQFGGIGGNFSKYCTYTITDCYNTGTIEATAKQGRVCAIVGLFENDATTRASVENCWNSGTITNSNEENTLTSANISTTTVQNCFDTQCSATGVTQVTDAQLASGEVTYKLNGNQSEITWTQTIGTDDNPVLTGSDRVYKVTSSATDYYYNGTVASMTLTDMADYEADADFTATSLTYDRKLEAGGYHSLCLPFEVTKTMLGEGSKLFTLSAIGKDAVTLNEVDKVAAGTPCFASVTTDLNFGTMSNVAMVASVTNGTNLKGTFTEITGDDAVDVYKLDPNGEYFAQTTSTGDAAVIKPFRSYIAAGASGVKTLNILLSDGTTSLTPTLSEEREAVIYDLAGRRVEKATKGLYIINGKKVVK